MRTVILDYITIRAWLKLIIVYTHEAAIYMESWHCAKRLSSQLVMFSMHSMLRITLDSLPTQDAPNR